VIETTIKSLTKKYKIDVDKIKKLSIYRQKKKTNILNTYKQPQNIFKIKLFVRPATKGLLTFSIKFQIF